MNFTITKEQANQLFQYLASKPWGEANALIQMLASLPQQMPTPSVPPTPSQDVPAGQ